MTDVRPTQIANFDRQIGGGLAPGTIVGIVTPPDSQGEQLLQTIARHHPTMYVSTTRAAAAVEEWVTPNSGDDSVAIDVHYAGMDTMRPRGGDALRNWLSTTDDTSHNGGLSQRQTYAAAQLDTILSAVTEGGQDVAIVDPINPLEHSDESMYTTFLHCIQQHLRDTDTIALLHMVHTPEPPPCRWLSLQMADEVWDLSVVIKNERVEFRLTVSKSRTGHVPTEQIKFHLNESVSIDTSRDIS